LPAESPIHGPRVIVENPADSVGSPFGWHDTNGVEGPEYTTTRGNNAHAYLDLDNSGQSQGDEPNGGDQLNFDFPMDLTLEPETYSDAAVTQLFYTNNAIHDMAYAYGFDEQAGNFQQNNYGNGGQGGDYIVAEAYDGSGTNNANFATPPDGSNGRMQMYLWSGGDGGLFQVNGPTPVAGTYEVVAAQFGAPITTDPVSGEALIADDGTAESSLACNPLENVEAMEGKVAIIDRGGCEFGLKALNAQEAGAIGVIICNFEDSSVGMAAGAVGAQVTIPVVSLGSTNCQIIREFAGQGLNVTFQIPDGGGPEFIDSGLDNGVIAHEYGHGISIRLTGGPSAVGCLGNDEQMGEGWSDFFSLITSVKPGDSGEMPRGIGTYVLRQQTNGSGIRRQRYSTDMSINNQTYDDIKGTTAPHPLGEIWTAVTWDLYWAFVEEYGWDPDLINGTGGNNMAIQLVMDGMKLQSCSPGFFDGREAIFMADELNYDGVHECLIWEVFARRGLGYFMDQGSANDRNDNTENFDALPTCIRELKITKTATPLIEAGEEVEITLTLTNHKGETVTGVMVEDEIPAGLTFIPGSVVGATATATGSAVSLEVGDMANGEVITITYKMISDEAIFSTTQYFDGMENDDENWFFLNLDPNGFNVWEISDLDPYEGEKCWFIENTEFVNDQVIFLQEPVAVSGTRPVMRFFHKYITESGFDGGVVEISDDGGISWTRVPERLIRNRYNTTLDYGTLVIPFLDVFSGDSEGWIDTYIDLTDYAGQDINFRFRFGSNEGGVPSGVNVGWFVDNIEIMDMINYNSEACV
ncbi:MAG: M36 family metallopeptidase, partial [Mameliella sp.]|nr:M36 family metallopeptidase [Phaeodactylibacter sp.]